MKKVRSRSGILLCTMVLFLAVFLMIPSKKAEAAGNYWLQINKGTNVVTVFTNEGAPVHAFVCSTGNATPTGTFYTSQKLRWHTLMGPSYGQYCTRITGSILFHSVFYNRNYDVSSMPYSAYNKLGTTASHGCVRLTVADAKWIYDNCPLSTRVEIINGAPYNDPLGKPEAIKVNTGAVTGWDPTDPAPGNPYAGWMPWISTGGASKKIAYKSSFSPLNGITAYDSLGNNVSHRLTYSGKVNTKKLGSYRITYSVTDALGRTAQTSVTYKVVDVKKAVIKGVKKKLTKEYNSTLKLKKNVKAYTVTGKNLTKKVYVKIVYPKTKKEKTYKKSTLRFQKLGTYKINYYVKNPNNKKITKVTCKVTVKDTKPPVISGVKSKKKAEYNSTTNLASKIKVKMRSGKNITSRLVVKIKAPGASKYKKLSTKAYKKYRFTKTGKYYVEYSASNPNKKKSVTKKKTVITVTDTKAPKLSGVSGNRTVQIGTSLNLRSGVTAKLNCGTNLTSSIQIVVTTPSGASSTIGSTAYKFEQVGTYKVYYTVKNPKSSKSTSKSILITVQDNRALQIVIAPQKVNTIQVGETYKVLEGVTAKLSDGTPIANIAVSITGVVVDEGTGTTQPITNIPQIVNGEITFTEAGTYTIIYRVVNPNNAAIAIQDQFVLTVNDTVPAPAPTPTPTPTPNPTPTPTP